MKQRVCAPCVTVVMAFQSLHISAFVLRTSAWTFFTNPMVHPILWRGAIGNR